MGKDARSDEAKRLAEARARRGFQTAKEAAEFFGWSYSTYSQHERGERGLTKKAAARYGKALHVSPAWLLTGENGQVEAPPAAPAQSTGRGRDRLVRVPILSNVSAGLLREAMETPPSDETIVLSGLPPGDYIALRVEGDSMNLVSPEGSVIIVDRRDRRPQRGKPYVFSIDGEATYKIWEPTPDRLKPRSTNPDNEPIPVQRKRDLVVIGRVRRTIFDP